MHAPVPGSSLPSTQSQKSSLTAPTAMVLEPSKHVHVFPLVAGGYLSAKSGWRPTDFASAEVKTGRSSSRCRGIMTSKLAPLAASRRTTQSRPHRLLREQEITDVSASRLPAGQSGFRAELADIRIRSFSQTQTKFPPIPCGLLKSG